MLAQLDPEGHSGATQMLIIAHIQSAASVQSTHLDPGHDHWDHRHVRRHDCSGHMNPEEHSMSACPQAAEGSEDNLPHVL